MTASPTCCLGAEADPWCKASVRGHPDWDPAGPSGCRPDWPVVSRQVLRRRARQPLPHQSEDVSWVLVLRCNPGRYRGPGPAADWGGMLFEPVGSYHPGSSKHPPRCSSSCASQGVRAAAAQPLILTASGPKRAKFRNRLTLLGLSARFSRLGARTKRNSRSRRIDGTAQRHLSVAHFYAHSQQRAHTEQWFRHRSAHKHRFHIVQNARTDLEPLQPKTRNWIHGSIGG